MDEVMEYWDEWMDVGVVTMIVMTLITMVRYSRIFARHDNPSLYLVYMNILSDPNVPSLCTETRLSSLSNCVI